MRKVLKVVVPALVCLAVTAFTTLVIANFNLGTLYRFFSEDPVGFALCELGNLGIWTLIGGLPLAKLIGD